jgi:hypothetical protein
MMCKDFSGPPPLGPVSTWISDRSCRDQRGHGASRLRRKKSANNQQQEKAAFSLVEQRSRVAKMKNPPT